MLSLRMPRMRTEGALSAFLLAVFLLAPAWGEGTGIVISGDSDDNISITIDPALVPELQIKRGNGQMTIRIPEGVSTENSGLDIAPGLRQSSAVQVNEAGQGRTVTVNSDRVYLSIQALNAAQEKAASAAAEKKPVGVAALPAISKAAPKATEGVSRPAIATLPTPPEPEAIRKALPPASPSEVSKKTPVKEGKPSGLATEEVISTLSIDETPVPTGTLEAVSLPKTEKAELFPPEPETAEALLSEGETGIPMEVLRKRRAVQSETSTNALVRLVLGLIVVLGMAVGFIRAGLPRLMAKYPEFFTRLQQQNSKNTAEKKAALESPMPFNDTAFQETSPSPARKSPRSAGRSLFDVLAGKRQLAKPVADSKRSYLERMSLPALFPVNESVETTGERFEVLTSQALGKGQELHLVSIKGRQLVVATTPYSVNLIADVTDGQPDVAETLTSKTLAFIEEAEAPTPSLLSDGGEAAEASTGTSGAAPHHKYLRNDAYKKYLSNPASMAVQRLQADLKDELASGATANSAPNRALNNSLNNPQDELESRQRQARAQQRRIQQELLSRQQSPRLDDEAAPPYVDAEEVVVLQDYDDIYQA